MATWHHILLPTAQGSGLLAAQRVGLPNLHYQYVLVDSNTFHTHLTIQYSPFNEVLSINNGEDYIQWLRLKLSSLYTLSWKYRFN